MKAAFVVALFIVHAQAAVGVRIIFGLTDRAEVKWDGSVAARGGRIVSIEPWRFEGTDALRGNSWTASTHIIRLFGGRGLFGNVTELPHVANGVMLYLDDSNENTSIDITTTQGNFTIRLSEIPYGKVANALSNRVMIDRIPPVTQLTSSPEEQDYPDAIADKNGNVWVAYMEFKHNPDHNHLRANVEQPITDFSQLKSPTGGDQVMLMKIVNGKASEPIAITPGGGDLYRPAIAMDGEGRPWVFWSQNDKGNFDVWGRVIDNGTPGPSVRISTAPGSDVDAVAALGFSRSSMGRLARLEKWKSCNLLVNSKRQPLLNARRGQFVHRQRMESIYRSGFHRTRHRRLGFVSQRKLRRLHAANAGAWGRVKPPWPHRLAMSVSFHRLRSIRSTVGRL